MRNFGTSSCLFSGWPHVHLSILIFSHYDDDEHGQYQPPLQWTATCPSVKVMMMIMINIGHANFASWWSIQLPSLSDDHDFHDVTLSE